LSILRFLDVLTPAKRNAAQLADDARRLSPLACRAALLRQLPSIPQIGCPFSLAPPTFRAIVVQRSGMLLWGVMRRAVLLVLGLVRTAVTLPLLSNI